jgi:hypothetical protein
MTTMRQPRRWLLAAELAVGAIVTAVIAVLGLSQLPPWAVALSSVGVYVAGVGVGYALIGRKADRVRNLTVATAALAATLLGTWIYAAAASQAPAFVNFVPNHDVTLSGEAGGIPRTSSDSAGLQGGELQSAYCWVDVKGQTWLDFQSGWGRLSDFHRPAGEPLRLPRRCG